MKKKIIIIISAVIILGVVGTIFLYQKYKGNDNISIPNNEHSKMESTIEIEDISCFNGNSEFGNEHVSFCVNELGSVYAHITDKQKNVLLSYKENLEINSNFFSDEGIKLDLEYKAKKAEDAVVGQEYGGKFIVLSETGVLYMYNTYDFISSKQMRLVYKYELPEKIISFTNCDYDRETLFIGDSCMISVKGKSETEYMLFDFPFEGFEQMYSTKMEFNEYIRENNKKFKEQNNIPK